MSTSARRDTEVANRNTKEKVVEIANLFPRRSAARSQFRIVDRSQTRNVVRHQLENVEKFQESNVDKFQDITANRQVFYCSLSSSIFQQIFLDPK